MSSSVIFLSGGIWEWLTAINWAGLAITTTGIITTLTMGGMQIYRAWCRLQIEITMWKRQVAEAPIEKLPQLFKEDQ